MDTATITAFNDELLKIALANGLDKDAGIISGAKKLLGLADEAAEAGQKFVPSFKGHSKEIAKAVGPAKTVSARTGAVTEKAWDPMTQTIKKQKNIPTDWVPPSWQQGLQKTTDPGAQALRYQLRQAPGLAAA